MEGRAVCMEMALEREPRPKGRKGQGLGLLNRRGTACAEPPGRHAANTAGMQAISRTLGNLPIGRFRPLPGERPAAPPAHA